MCLLFFYSIIIIKTKEKKTQPALSAWIPGIVTRSIVIGSNTLLLLLLLSFLFYSSATILNFLFLSRCCFPLVLAASNKAHTHTHTKQFDDSYKMTGVRRYCVCELWVDLIHSTNDSLFFCYIC